MKKRIVVDVMKLSNPYVGLGQVALYLGKALTQIAAAQDEFELCFLVPKDKQGVFGDAVRYITPKWWQRYFSFGYDKVDVWHALHQDVAFLPKKGTAMLLTIHDFNFMYEKSPSKAAKRLSRVRRLMARSKQITTISDFVRAEMKKFAAEGFDKSTTIYNGVPDLTTIATNSIIRGDYLFTVANWTARKQLHRLIEVMEAMPETELVVAGNVDTAYARPLVDRVAEKGLKVRFVEKISDEEKANYYAQCLAFVFPSRIEGFGLPLIEAMQFGKAVVTTDGTCLPEIGGDVAYYWREGDSVAKNVETIRRAIAEDTEALQLARMERAKVFTWEKAAMSFWEKYTFMVKGER